MPSPNLSNGWEATLTSGISDSDLTCDVDSIEGIPDRPFQTLISHLMPVTGAPDGTNWDELLTVTDVTGTTLDIERAAERIGDGTQVASAHSAGTTISQVLTKASLLDIAYWARGPIDTPPSNPDPMDDEFEGDALDGKWTIWNQQAGQLVRLAGSHLNLYSPYTIQARIFAVIQPAPSETPPWKFRFKTMLDAPGWSHIGVGPVVRRVTGHDYSVQTFLGFINGQQCTFWEQMDDGVSYRGRDTDLYNLNFPCYMEIEFNGSSIIFRASGVGDFYSEVTRFHTPDIGGEPEWLGINIYPWGDGNYHWHGSASMDWFRKVPIPYQNAIPMMTSETAPSGTASEESVHAGAWWAYHAMNGSDDSSYPGWIAVSGHMPTWIAYEFPTPQTVVCYGIRPWFTDDYPARSPRDWTFEGWNGSSWDVLDTVSGWGWSSLTEMFVFTVDVPASYAKYRVNITTNGGSSYTAIGQLQMYVAR